ncbi:MAG: hypothetical protein IPM74_19300 [Crocinitomicaceae bacterium]|nr:hypothetical protein [Crocinitomicaceae bacterium]
MNAENTVFNSDDNVVSTSLNTIETEREKFFLINLETDNSTELEEGEFYAPSKSNMRHLQKVIMPCRISSLKI